MFKQFFVQSNQKGIGGRGEDIAAKFLRRKGYKILEKNWYNPTGKRLGEIDLIAKERDGTIVFVEVKSRQVTCERGDILPEEQITSQKLHKLNRIAEYYIAHKALWQTTWRIDAVSVVFVSGKRRPDVRHIKNIFY